MRRTLTPPHEPDQQERPSRQTIQNILNYSKAYQARKLKSGFEFEMLSN